MASTSKHLTVKYFSTQTNFRQMTEEENYTFLAAENNISNFDS